MPADSPVPRPLGPPPFLPPRRRRPRDYSERLVYFSLGLLLSIPILVFVVLVLPIAVPAASVVPVSPVEPDPALGAWEADYRAFYRSQGFSDDVLDRNVVARRAAAAREDARLGRRIDRRIERRVRRLEARIAALERSAGVSPSPPPAPPD